MNLSKIHHIAIIVSGYGEGVCSYFSGFSAFFFFGAILWPE